VEAGLYNLQLGFLAWPTQDSWVGHAGHLNYFGRQPKLQPRSHQFPTSKATGVQLSSKQPRCIYYPTGAALARARRQAAGRGGIATEQATAAHNTGEPVGERGCSGRSARASGRVAAPGRPSPRPELSRAAPPRPAPVAGCAPGLLPARPVGRQRRSACAR